jgi:hypothetical protein
MTSMWCEKDNCCIDFIGYKHQWKYKSRTALAEARKQVGARVRCPKCKQRFEPIVKECHDPGCWHVFMPKHKERIKKIKKITRKTKSYSRHR